jgi:2'-5' RNA ligase
MPLLRYALVAYVKAPVGEFVERLRGELHPALSHLPAHLTVLPPRPLQGTEEEARQVVESVCRQASPFEVLLGEVETFVPVTPTVFLRVAHAAYRLRELHDQLNRNALQAEEPWPYMPHLTIVKMSTEEEAGSAFEVAQKRWSQYQGSRRVLIEELTFVREAPGDTWEDLAPVPLGGSLAVKGGL